MKTGPFRSLLRIIQVIGLCLIGATCFGQAVPDNPKPPQPYFLKQRILSFSGSMAVASHGISSDQASDAFFCQKERHLEKWLGVPIRFRVGDQATVDSMEKKWQSASVQ